MLAQAESDSAGVQYEDAPPSITVPGNTKKAHKSQPGNKSQEAESSNVPGAGGGSGGGSHGGGSNNPSSGGQNPSTGSGSGSGQGNPGNGSTESGKPGSLAQNTESGQPASSSSGGSSPLVPILIAIAVLAAVSIGVVMYRQRRQSRDAGGAVSPKAS